MELQLIDTAPRGREILATDGKWWAAVFISEDAPLDSWMAVRIYHFAVSQEYDWVPTHWCELPELVT